MKFTNLFEKQAEENRLAVQNATETKANYAQQSQQLENELRMNFNTFEADQSRISDLVSSIVKREKMAPIKRYVNTLLVDRSKAKQLL